MEGLHWEGIPLISVCVGPRGESGDALVRGHDGLLQHVQNLDPLRVGIPVSAGLDTNAVSSIVSQGAIASR
jgi:hypothetical protein